MQTCQFSLNIETIPHISNPDSYQEDGKVVLVGVGAVIVPHHTALRGLDEVVLTIVLWSSFALATGVR